VRKIAILNQKGGVGKTTTTVNLAAALAETGLRVCIVDMDPQSHATLHLGVTPQSSDSTVYQVLVGQRSVSDVCQQVHENLWLVSSHIDLAAAEVELAGVVGRELILRDALPPLEDRFDYLLIDCPPSLSVLTINALAAVNEVFIPLQPHFLALHGLSKLLETIELVAGRLNKQLKLSGVILCMYESGTRLAAEVSRDVESFFDKSQGHETPWSNARAYQTRIRRNIRLAEAPSFGQSILEYAPQSAGAADYRELAREFLSEIGALPADENAQVPRRRALPLAAVK